MKKILIVLLVAVMFLFGTFSAAMATRVLSEKLLVEEEESQSDPAIYGDIVVWEDYRTDDDYDIYGYNLRTGQEFPICTEEDDQNDPAIYGDIVVWEDHRNGNDDDIYLAYLDVVCETVKKSLPMEKFMKILGLWPKE